MKLLLTCGIAGIFVCNALGDTNRLWGVTLVSRSISAPHIGAGIPSYSFSVEGGGTNASQMTTLYATSDSPSYASSSASVSATLTIQPYWLGLNPPTKLYINECQVGQVSFQTHLYGNPWVTEKAWASSSAGQVSIVGGTDDPWSPDTNAVGIYKKTSIPVNNCTWDQIGTLNGVPFWALHNPLTYSPPVVSVSGEVGIDPDDTAWGSSSGIAGLGLGYFVADHPWPVSSTSTVSSAVVVKSK